MKKEVIYVPYDKCPLDILAEAEMGKKTQNSWIFLHRNAFEKLRFTADKHVLKSDFNHTLQSDYNHLLHWNATDSFPETTVLTQSIFLREGIKRDWIEILKISASDISFKEAAQDPEYLFFLKMAKK